MQISGFTFVLRTIITMVWTSWVNRATYDKQASIRTERIVNKPAIEFYGIAQDPDELANPAREPAYQALIQNYRVKLEEWMEAQGDKGAALDVLIKRD